MNPPDQLHYQFVLASRSPRRRELLHDAGYDFVVDPSDVDEEDYSPEVLPSDLALKLARIKSHAVSARRPEDLILAADTVVALGDRSLGKPEDPTHARAMLRLLSGTTQIVITGVSITCRATGYMDEKRVMSAVQMKHLSTQEIDAYVESGAWQGKAGGYGIQDNDPFVTRTGGCYTNIVGLPMKATRLMLAQAGVNPTRHGR
jgi:septum formation protein